MVQTSDDKNSANDHISPLDMNASPPPYSLPLTSPSLGKGALRSQASCEDDPLSPPDDTELTLVDAVGALTLSNPNDQFPIQNVWAQGGRIISKPHKKGVFRKDSIKDTRLTSITLPPACWERYTIPGPQQDFAPVLIKSNSHWLSESFPLIFPDESLKQRDISFDDWSTFIENIRITATLPPGQHALSQVLPFTRFVGIEGYLASRCIERSTKRRKLSEVLETVRQWNERFFAQRGVKVTIRPDWIRMGDDISQAFSRKGFRKHQHHAPQPHDRRILYSTLPSPTSVETPGAVAPSMPVVVAQSPRKTGKCWRECQTEGRTIKRNQNMKDNCGAMGAEKEAHRDVMHANGRRRHAIGSWCRVGGKYDLVVESL